MNAGFKLMNKGGLNDKMEVSFLVRLKTGPGKFRHSSAPSQRASEAANEDPQYSKLQPPRKRVRPLKWRLGLKGFFTLRNKRQLFIFLVKVKVRRFGTRFRSWLQSPYVIGVATYCTRSVTYSIISRASGRFFSTRTFIMD